MLNERFTGMITSVAASIRTAKQPDGQKVKEGIYKVKLESADIDYNSISKFNSNISSTLLNIQPAPFKSVNFGDQKVFKLCADLYSEEEDGVNQRTGEDEIEGNADARYEEVEITNLTVSIKDNIPIYIFVLEIPMTFEGGFLFHNLKKKISFEFSKM